MFTNLARPLSSDEQLGLQLLASAVRRHVPEAYSKDVVTRFISISNDFFMYASTTTIAPEREDPRATFTTAIPPFLVCANLAS